MSIQKNNKHPTSNAITSFAGVVSTSNLLVGSPIIKYMYRKLMANKNPFQNSDVCK
jgi:hypothetical protein